MTTFMTHVDDDNDIGNAMMTTRTLVVDYGGVVMLMTKTKTMTMKNTMTLVTMMTMIHAYVE